MSPSYVIITLASYQMHVHYLAPTLDRWAGSSKSCSSSQRALNVHYIISAVKSMFCVDSGQSATLFYFPDVCPTNVFDISHYWSWRLI